MRKEKKLPYNQNTGHLNMFRNGVEITPTIDANLLKPYFPFFALNSPTIRLKKLLSDSKIFSLNGRTYFDSVPKDQSRN